MEIKTLEKLEFNKVCDIVKNYAITENGKNLCQNMLPLSSFEEIKKELKKVTEASNLLYRKGNPPFSEIADITEIVKKLNSGLFLNIKQLLDLCTILRTASNLKDYFYSTEIDMSEFELLDTLFNNLYVNPTIVDTISRAIIDENTIDDHASSNLNSIKKSIKSKEQEIKNKLNQIIHSKYVQESVITLRSGRFVVPVKNEYRSEVKGFIHDISASGSTVFIEPIAVFDLNNDLSNLKKEEELEIERILQRLSGLFYDIIPSIENNVNLIGIIDFIFAKAKYSNSIDATEPILNSEKLISLNNAWHPLLDKSKAIKNSISIGENYTTLVITGPNTGGKTVTLKTVGLLVLMAISGMHIPAGANSIVFVPDNIFADIGDDQSIADSLSTFSSHMTNIAHIINKATSRSFVLIDELGSGTDPVEGSSLAIAVLEKLKEVGSIVLSTTHYPEIKHFALVTDGFENASVEFNIDTLSPTYKLLLGVPGTSNAFAISKKLGIPDEIIEKAKEYTDTSKISVEELLTNIYEDKRLIEQEKAKTIENSERIEKLKVSLETDFAKLKEEERNIIADAKEKARDILLDAKDDVNDIIKSVEKSNSNKEANRARNKLNKKISDLSVKKTMDVKTPVKAEDLVPGTEVYIDKIGQYGKILSVSKDNKVQVGLTLGKMYFNIDEIEIKSSSKKNDVKTDYSLRKDTFKAKAISPEINLLGYTVDEATSTLDKYLDECYLAGLTQVRVVHGKGTGALRTGIQAYLKNHPHVKSYRIGTYGEGEMGVTIVELK